MTEKQTRQINALRETGAGFKKIAELTGLSRGTIKDMEERLLRAGDFKKELRKLNKPLEKFDDEIFIRLVDHLEVESNDNIKIVWRGEV